MATQAEIEAAAAAIQAIEDPLEPVCEFIAAARAALEAAERVRPRRDPTAAKRLHAHRARRRAERNVAGNVAGDAPAAGNVSGETLHPEGNVSAPIDKIDPEPAPILSMPGGKDKIEVQDERANVAAIGRPAIEIHPANGRRMIVWMACHRTCLGATW